MIRRLIRSPWEAEDVAKLKELGASGATALRTAAALGRPLSSVKRKANDLGIQLLGIRKLRAELRDRGAIEARRRH